jgi:hypothetical protein
MEVADEPRAQVQSWVEDKQERKRDVADEPRAQCCRPGSYEQVLRLKTAGLKMASLHQ